MSVLILNRKKQENSKKKRQLKVERIKKLPTL